MAGRAYQAAVRASSCKGRLTVMDVEPDTHEMNSQDEARWNSARTLADLGEMTALWFLTDCSQPGEESGTGYDSALWVQRAAVGASLMTRL